MLSLGIMALVAGALRLGAALVVADTESRRDAVYWVLAGTLVAIAPF